MIVIARTFSLELDQPGWKEPNNPLIGWKSVITPAMLTATYEDGAYPVENLANESTFLRWRSSTAGEQYITVATGADEPDVVDYIGLAGHNFGSGQIPFSVEVLSNSNWVEVVSPTLVPDDRPILIRFESAQWGDIRLRLFATGAVPEVAVMYLGQLLVLQRRIYVGHTPINYGRRLKIINGKSELGNFLGRITTTESRETSVSMQNITPAWYRAKLDPFLENRLPFFFAWRPYTYPREVGYAWLTADPKVSNQRANGMMSVSMSLGGIA